MDWIWPIKTGRTFFDVWTIVHFSFWVFVGHIAWVFHWNRWYSMLCFIALAFIWEGFERYMEPRHPDLWQNPESWVNAYLSDGLFTCILGVLFIWYALDHWRV
jgi:hypothetical protein